MADTSVAFDTQVKARLYRKPGISEFWVIDVPEGCLRVFTEVSSKGYKRQQIFERSDTVKSIMVSDLVMKVKELMP